jgi:ComF family protein
MGFYVKNTTLTKIADVICPHYCVSCGGVGAILCSDCKKYNSTERVECCIKCGKACTGICKECKLPFLDGCFAGYLDELVGKMAKKYKYAPTRALAGVLAEMMAEALPCLPEETVVVPIPTIERHVRERGFGHTERLAKELAKLRGWKIKKVVGRRKNVVQVGNNRMIRQKQAEGAFCVREKPDSDKVYLVIDDVWTTGATMTEVCKILREAGAERVFAAVLARGR